MNRFRSVPGKRVAIRAVLLTLSLLAGCSVLRRPLPPVDRSYDAQILRQVEARLAAESAIDEALIRVEVDGGVVLLYGSVAGIEAWNCAIRNAQLVPNVRTVVDFLVIERGPREIPCLAPRTTDLSLARIVPRLDAGL